MRRSILACSVLGSLMLAGCSAGAPGAADDPLGSAENAIAYRTLDTTHTAVVSILAPDGAGAFSECSGTVLQVKNGSAYVLTAAHCCDNTVPTLVVTGNDYSAGEQYIFGGTPEPPSYAVTAGSIYYDSKYVPNTASAYDFCMLKFAAPAGMASIPPAQPGDDGLALGVEVKHVGFGETDTNSNNSQRWNGTAPVNLQLTTTILQSSQGGPTDIMGVCEGDSGGPALVPAGAPQSQQMVVGTTSTGDATSCASNTENTCMRVTSETGPGGFITTYLDDAPVGGTQPGTTQASCQTCAQSSETGACESQAQACGSDQACETLSQCLGQCAGAQTCVNTCASTAG